MQPFSDRLCAAVRLKKTPVLVGLDPRWNLLPEQFTAGKDSTDCETLAQGYYEFSKGVIDVVAPLVPAIKPQAAFYEELGVAGVRVLIDLIHYATAKGLLVILDAKRGDIGTTAAAYAGGMLGSAGQSCWGADALTVNPYLGDDSLTPFAETANKRQAGIFILVKTSNPGGALFQDRISEGRPIYEYVADYVQALALESRDTAAVSCRYGNVGAVVGATWSKQLTELREKLSASWLLIPGYGSQGGGAADVAGAFDEQGLGAVINNSRGILFAHRSDRFAHFGSQRWEEAVEAATREMIEDLAANTLAGKLR